MVDICEVGSEWQEVDIKDGEDASTGHTDVESLVDSRWHHMVPSIGLPPGVGHKPTCSGLASAVSISMSSHSVLFRYPLSDHASPLSLG